MKRKLIYVRWLDACYLGNEWKLKDEMSSKGEGFEMVSCGHLVSEDERGIYLATDCDPKEEGRFRHVSFIPHKMIVKRKVIQVEI